MNTLTTTKVEASFSSINSVDSLSTTPLPTWQKLKAYSALTDFWAKNQYQSFMSQDITISNYIPAPKENFSTMIILDLCLNNFDLQLQHAMLEFIEKAQLKTGFFYFFEDHNLLPMDVDSTTCGLAILHKAQRINNHKQVHEVIDKILDNVSAKGVIEVYLDAPEPKKGRIDPCVCANVLYLLNLYGREKEAQLTEDFIHQTLYNEDYLQGSIYYPSPDVFLFNLCRLVLDFPHYQNRFLDLLKEKLSKRIGSSDSAFELALRVKMAKDLKMNNEKEKDMLISQQLNDGSWPAHAFFKGNTKYGYFGSQALTTAFAVRALESN